MAIKNQALTVTYFAWDTGNQVGKTGDAANHTMYVSIDGVANAVDDTSSVEVDATNLQGHYQVTLTAAEMNGDHIMLGGESSTSDIVIIPTSITTERGNLATIDANVDSILVDTDVIDDGTSGLVKIAQDVAAVLVDTGTNGVVLAADAITSAKIADDAIATEHIATGAITADSIADNAIDAGALKADAIDLIWDEVLEGTLTARQIQRLALAVLAGITTGGGTTAPMFRDNADSKNRVAATVDTSGNRTAVTLDGS